MRIQHEDKCLFSIWNVFEFDVTFGFNIIWKYNRKAISLLTELYINVFINVFDAVVSVVSAKLRTSGKKMIKISQFGVSVTRETMAKPQIIISYSQMIHLLIIDRLSSFWVHLYFITEFLRLRLFGRLLWLIWHLREGRRPMVTPCAINYGRDVKHCQWPRFGFIQRSNSIYTLQPATLRLSKMNLEPTGRTNSVRFWIEYLPDIDAHTDSSVEEMRFSTITLYVIYRASILIS